MKAVSVPTARAPAAGMKPDGAETARTRTGSAASANATAADPDLSGLTLNATCIARNQRSAIINGRVYRQKDKLDLPNSADSPVVLAEILPRGVMLQCRGKRVPLGYPNTATSGPDAARAGDSRDKNALPPELADMAPDPRMTQLLENVQKGVAGLDKMMNVLSDGKQ